MDKIAHANNNERKSIFIEAANRTSLNNFVIEKNFWESWIISRIFNNDELSQILYLKGGTSVEDIDIIISGDAKTLIRPFALFEKIRYVLANICSIYPYKYDALIFLVKYPHVFDCSFIQPEIKLKIDYSSLQVPNELYPVSSFVAKALPELNLNIPRVPTIW